MATVTEPLPAQAAPGAFPAHWTFADVQEHLGGIPPSRIRMFPLPGAATAGDVAANAARKQGICELIDGILVEKTVGWLESRIAILIAVQIESFRVEAKQRGMVLGTDGTVRILSDQVRAPDMAFYGPHAFVDGKLPVEAVPSLVPDLAVEVLSASNTKREMERKLREYFEAGVRLVWYVDPETRSAKVYTAVDQFTQVAESGELEGGEVLPGFRLSLAKLFADAETLP